jgi:hypothetical protein
MNGNDGNNWQDLIEENECERNNSKCKVKVCKRSGYRCKRNMYVMLKQIQRKQNQTDKKLNLIASILMSKLSGQNEFTTEQFEISYIHQKQQNEDTNVNSNNNTNKVVVNVQMEEKIIESSNNNNNNNNSNSNNNPNKFSNVINMNDDEGIKNIPQQQQQQQQPHHINLQKYKIEQEEIIETINIDKEMNINQLVSEQDPNNNNNNNSECVSRSDYSQISDIPQDNCRSLQSSSSSTKTKKIRGFNFNMKKKKAIDSVSSSYSKDNDSNVVNAAKEVKKFDIQRFTIKQKQDKAE